MAFPVETAVILRYEFTALAAATCAGPSFQAPRLFEPDRDELRHPNFQLPGNFPQRLKRFGMNQTGSCSSFQPTMTATMAPSRIDLERDLAQAETRRELALNDAMEHLESDYSGASTPALYTGVGKDDAPRSPVRKPHKKNGSPKVNGVKHETEARSLVYEKHQDADGEHLTSVEPSAGFEVASRRNGNGNSRSERTEREELVSGRQAGAGWQRSG